MSKEKRILRTEFIVLIVLWILMFTAPVIFNDQPDREIDTYYVMWIEFALVGIIFMVHRFLLLPRLFFKKKYYSYMVAVIFLITAFAVFLYYFKGVDVIKGYIGGSSDLASPPPRTLRQLEELGLPGFMDYEGRPMKAPMKIIPPQIGNIILAIFILLLDIGMAIATKWVIAEQKRTVMENENINAKLIKLQSQVSPHFFMNTLNNIHALVEIDPARAQKTIIELSGLMDYLLYESSSINVVSVQREIDFINSYINLMRLRYPKRVNIDFNCIGKVPTAKIPPLLFLNFIENTFKYGVDYTKESFILIGFNFSDKQIEMICKNSNHSATVKRTRRGFGLTNSRKRLDLIYENNYTLEIDDNQDIFSVNLKIPTIQ